MSKSLYVAGPMSGLPDFNFPAFYAAAAQFEEEGWIVWNPANKEGETLSEASKVDGDHIKAKEDGFNFRSVFMWDIDKVINSDAIYMLPGWENSAGARAEYAVALAVQKHYPEYKIFYEKPRNMTFGDAFAFDVCAGRPEIDEGWGGDLRRDGGTSF